LFTSSILLTVSLHCGIRDTKLEVVGLETSSRTSRQKSPALTTDAIVLEEAGTHVMALGTRGTMRHLH
jgi:hypothetical protein